MLGYHTPFPRTRQAPPTPGPGRHPPPRTRHPLGSGTPPPTRRAYWEIQSTSGRYASYWNAFLLVMKQVICQNINSGGSKGCTPPLSLLFLFPCSFNNNFAKQYVGVPSSQAGGPLWEMIDPPLISNVFDSGIPYSPFATCCHPSCGWPNRASAIGCWLLLSQGTRWRRRWNTWSETKNKNAFSRRPTAR